MITRTDHLLLKLMEECAEVQQRAAKMMQFGSQESEPGQALTNQQRLRDEVNDLLAVIDMMEQVELLPFVEPELLGIYFSEKREKIGKYLRYSQELGRIE